MVTWMDDRFRATTPAQAKLLLSLRGGLVLGSLLKSPGGQSAAEVAREVGKPLSQVHRTLGQLLDAELIAVIGTRPRAGRPCKLYAALASAYEVPFHLSDAATLRELNAAHYKPFFEAFLTRQSQLMQAQGRDTMRLRMDGDQLSYQLVKQNGQRHKQDFYGLFSALNLTPAQAETLQAELRQLGEKYSQGNPDGQPYLLGLLFSPGELES